GTVAPGAVPSIVGASEAAAREALGAALFGVGAVTRAASPSVPAGLVISQTPAAGSAQALGTPVAFVVSLGNNGARVPDVRGMTQSAAANAITGAGFVLGGVKQGVAGRDAPGTVRSQSPVAGAAAPSGSAIALLVAPGSAGNVTVPSVIALSQAGATSALQAVGLVVGTVTTQSSPTVAAGHVIAQTPIAGSSVPAGSAVALVVSTGPANVTVPNVVGLPQASATSALATAGLVAGTVTSQASPTVPAGNVISQSPLAGASVPAGSAVALVVSLGPVCAVFTDVPAASPFCSSVEWMRNRAITLGCTGSAYCPNADVSRLAMAAFMTRLGSALSASAAVVTQASGAFDPGPGHVVCASAPVSAAGSPRRVVLDGVASLIGSAAATLVVEPVVSLDGGSTWTALVVHPAVAGVSATAWSSVRVLAARDLAVGDAATFALRVSRGGFGGTATIADSACRLRVSNENRQGATAPFDR
ncbi:MAG TPA: PASTA domain-containing protein, partial [Casimicrobiaceae bacterium]|nr:PASTA domain-containing protein [Casimicrobiaceae bacterium]